MQQVSVEIPGRLRRHGLTLQTELNQRSARIRDIAPEAQIGPNEKDTIGLLEIHLGAHVAYLEACSALSEADNHFRMVDPMRRNVGEDKWKEAFHAKIGLERQVEEAAALMSLTAEGLGLWHIETLETLGVTPPLGVIPGFLWRMRWPDKENLRRVWGAERMEQFVALAGVLGLD